MLKNHLIVAWRNLLRGKIYSFINISGLALGMAVALLIGLWIWDELSFNNWHTKHGRIAQVMDSQTINGAINTAALVAIPLSDELRNDHGDDFKHVALVFRNYTHVLAAGNKKLSQSGVWAEPDLPEILTLHMLSGRRDALKDPSAVLITRSLAKALFGDTDAMNQPIRLDNMANFKVAGVFEDLPENTSFYGTNLFLPWERALSVMPWLKDSQSSWDTRGWRLLVEMNDHCDMDKVTTKIKYIPQKHLKGGNEEILLHPMDKWHLYSDFSNGKVAGGRIRIVWLFGIIGTFVLLLACINFMNLSTARSEKRAKETGIRKAIGSSGRQLIGKYLFESLLVAFLAGVLAIILVMISLPFFDKLTEKVISFPWNKPLFWLTTFVFIFLTGMVSGSYPAFYLSRFNPIKVLKGQYKAGPLSSLLRKVLVVSQFTVSIVLIIGTIIVFQQIQYAKSRSAGFTKEGLIVVSMNTPELYDLKYNALRNELRETAVVEDMAESSTGATDPPYCESGFSWQGKNPGFEPVLEITDVTHDFGRTLGWQVKDGRDFSRQFATDSGAFILNESMARLTGLKNPVGEIITWNGMPHLITGVVKDMVMESPYKRVLPAIFTLNYHGLNWITVRIIKNTPILESLAKIAAIFRKFNPESPFVYKFMDEEYARKFSDEQRIANLSTVFAVLAIFISCLGLFGLASFVAEQRTKEIGIRKILGASIFNVWGLLSKEFVILVFLSLLIAMPAAWHFLYRWLQQYEYRTTISWWIFATAGLGILSITMLTVSYQSIKAAMINPVKSLKCE